MLENGFPIMDKFQSTEVILQDYIYSKDEIQNVFRF